MAVARHAQTASLPDTLITTYLHMTDRSQFIPAFLSEPGVSLMMMQQVDVHFYKFLYTAVGDIWRWRDRIVMPESELKAALEDPGTSVHVMYADGVPAGYVELYRQGTETEIAYFGLRPAYMGRGLGKHLLSYGIQQAWDGGTTRVHVHTCNLDAPGALPNYLKRGFSVYNVVMQPMPQRYAI
ncbi:GNAT family N-acetyltransferase [Anaerolineae bacterium CFX9]|nr:GNAT family N-acetyltransferase [Anaerolineae bacterium CFX9]